MEILVNNRQEITAYAITGGITNGIVYTGLLPDDFVKNYKPSLFLFQNNKIIYNPNYVEPTPSKPDVGPTTEQLMINQLGLQVAQLTTKVNELGAILMVDYGFVKQMHDWGCNISDYLAMGAITQTEYDQIMGDSDGTI